MADELREDRLRANLEAVRERIGRALLRSPDPAREVTIVGVTKTAPASVVDALAAAGIRDIGENRVQEALEKAPAVRSAVRWHLIGHLQTNKARRAAEFFSVVHSVDSPRVLAALSAAGRPLRLLLQVNVSGEARKSGVAPEAAGALLRDARRTPGVQVLGLMTIAPYSDDPQAARPVFRGLRELLEALNRPGDGPPMRELSMGMSGDFEVAVEEGATIVRLGTALLGPIRARHV
jgi:hypothetical protein